MKSSNLHKKIKIMLWILMPILIAMSFNSIKEKLTSKRVEAYINTVKLQIPENFDFNNPKTRHFNLLTIKILNHKDEEISLRNIEVHSLFNFKGFNVYDPFADKLYKPAITFELSKEGVLKVSSEISIPANETSIIYIWTEEVSDWPLVKINSNKGKVDINSSIQVDNRFKYLMYENIYLITIFIAVLLFIILFALMRKGEE